MNRVAIAVLLVFGISVAGSVFACEGSKHSKEKTGTTAPAVPTPAPTK